MGKREYMDMESNNDFKDYFQTLLTTSLCNQHLQMGKLASSCLLLTVSLTI